MSWWTETFTEMLRVVVRVFPLPAMSIGAGVVEDPTPDLRDQAAALGERHEHRRRHGAARRMRPPEEGFDAGDASGSRLDNGLVLRSELTAFRRAPQVAFEGRPLVGPMLLAQVDDLVAGAGPCASPGNIAGVGIFAGAAPTADR